MGWCRTGWCRMGWCRMGWCRMGWCCRHKIDAAAAVEPPTPLQQLQRQRHDSTMNECPACRRIMLNKDRITDAPPPKFPLPKPTASVPPALFQCRQLFHPHIGRRPTWRVSKHPLTLLSARKAQVTPPHTCAHAGRRRGL
eukprot:200983-Chlamydomonas_euryale.AAC.1